MPNREHNIDMPEKYRSLISACRVAGRSRLTSCRSVAPLKILSPRTYPQYCAAILSSYGGGLVDGDKVDLQVQCGPGAGLFLGTQAFTKVYRSTGRGGCSQVIHGTIGAGGCVVVLPDPVVPYADSLFRQEQFWELGPEALLIVVDWFTAGRLARGEQFQYGSYASDITVSRAGRPLLADRQLVQPSRSMPRRVGAFGESSVSMNLFVVGSVSDPRFQGVTEFLAARFQGPVQSQVRSSQANRGRQVLVSSTMARPEVYVARVLGQSTAPVQDFVQLVGESVAEPSILGENPLCRKY